MLLYGCKSFAEENLYRIQVRLNGNLLKLYIKLFNYDDTYPYECMCASSCLIFDESVYL